MKVIYYFDNDCKSNGENDIIFPNENGIYDIPTNATDITPEQGLYQPLHFNIDKQKWEGASKEEWEKEHSNEEDNLIEPPNLNSSGTDEELRVMFANMQVQLVQANMMVMQLSQQNAQLSQQLVKLNQEIETLKGENSDETTIS
ncbi:hypothetical protein BU100_07260 [Staphylococcus xylosus]|uniref:hypothetical protein n=1 Tax=Staphylococcus xylosus TaxID=1288 RepID=UPI000E6793C8|nr:hypothetical protein [Staphylococcus xylosus]RIM94794.1 hypothetical protein BU100_07260 [Staphylococcus xylosus]